MVKAKQTERKQKQPYHVCLQHWKTLELMGANICYSENAQQQDQMMCVGPR